MTPSVLLLADVLPAPHTYQEAGYITIIMSYHFLCLSLMTDILLWTI
jgi:hypothetical protein